MQIKYGFVHVEKHGVIAVDQKGGGAKLAQTRLYLYPDVEEQVLYQIILGDKNTQAEDIKFCNWFVAQLRKRKEDDTAETEPGNDTEQKEIQERSGDGPSSD